MKSTLLISVLAPTILAAQTMPVQPNAQRPRYTVRDLGVLGTGDNASGFGINNFGWVAGSSNRTSGGPQHAFVWFGGGPFIDIGTLGL